MLFIGGIVAIVVFTIQVYKTASGTGRNAAVWAAITALVGVAFQFVIPIFLGIALALYYMFAGSPIETIEADLQGPSMIIGIICLILSIVGMVLVSKHVSKVVDVPVGSPTQPPPPPRF